MTRQSRCPREPGAPKPPKISPEHFEAMCDFFEAHPGMAVGQLDVNNARQTLTELWDTLACRLNSINYRLQKKPNEWRKVFDKIFITFYI